MAFVEIGREVYIFMLTDPILLTCLIIENMMKKYHYGIIWWVLLCWGFMVLFGGYCYVGDLW